MTEKELKHLSRRELLEMLVLTTRKNEQLEKKINELQNEIEERNAAVVKAGSFSKVSSAFQKAYQTAFDVSEMFVFELTEQKKKSDEESKLIIREAKNEAKRIIREAKIRAAGGGGEGRKQNQSGVAARAEKPKPESFEKNEENL